MSVIQKQTDVNTIYVKAVLYHSDRALGKGNIEIESTRGITIANSFRERLMGGA